MLNVAVTWLHFTRRAKYDLNHFRHQKQQHLVFTITFCLCDMQYLHHLYLGIHRNTEQYLLLAYLFLMIAVSPCRGHVFGLFFLFRCFYSTLQLSLLTPQQHPLYLCFLLYSCFSPPWGKRCTVAFSVALSSMTYGGYLNTFSLYYGK